MKVDVDIKDQDNLRDFLKLFPNAALKGIEKDCADAANDLRNNVIVAMQTTPRLIGRRTKSGKMHHPSAPGFPPAVDSGNYVRKIFSERIPGGGHTFVKGVPYFNFLEDGTVNMKARPVWNAQIEKVDGEKNEKVSKSVARFIKTT